MKRKNFLRSLGLGGIALFASPFASIAKDHNNEKRGGCSLIPSETPGPFPLDLSENDFFFRQNISEDLAGTEVIQKLRIIGTENCHPMPNVRVNIWCCDLEGAYSGYGELEGLTYQRGYQITDGNGEVEFRMVFPGWYPGRVVHMHFQVFVSTQYSVVSQYTWPHDMAVQIANESPELYTQGPDPMTPEVDGAFIDGYEHQLATLEIDPATGSYTSFLEVAIDGAGVDGVGYLESQASQVFALGCNSPNPASMETTFPLTLYRDAEVEVEVWSIAGKIIFTENLGTRASGNHNYTLNFSEKGMAQGSYVFQVNIIQNGRKHNDLKRFLVL
ncbi:MAG: hypothetical protein CMB32_05455 [Euryarchaeota archaeon]|nr:hypothetical protein [Euryarchaeota archaeon]|tara:strand:- start:1017 stop:2006 length:990 start_codon:yes stop_codon:yes gene_type:complete